MASTDRPPGLDRLEPFLGEWTLEAVFPNQPPMDVRGRVWFEWALDRQFLVERSEVPGPVPDGLCIIGVDAGHDTFTQHYFDSRGIARLYAMTFDGRVWTLLRAEGDFTPLEFSQRFTGTFDDDGSTIRGRWETSHDGTTWEHDFDLTYTKVG
jgi:hypothetical protein